MRLPHEVLVLVRRDQQFLVLHRSERQGAYWHSVAGGVEPGESAADAAWRELQEETGLAVEPVPTGRQFTYVPETWELHAGIGTVHVDCLTVDAPPGWEPVLDWEHDAYRWCDAAEAVELLYWPEPADFIRELALRDPRRRA